MTALVLSFGFAALLTAAVALGLPVAIALRTRAARREAARRVGLGRVSETVSELVGWAGPLRVRLSGYVAGRAAGRITLSGPGLPAHLTVRHEDLDFWMRPARGVRDIETGDATFDEVARVEGSPAVARALLDAETRRVFLGLVQGHLERERLAPFRALAWLKEGELTVEVPDGGGHLARLPEILEGVLAFARRLAPPKDPARRIADNLEAEPEAGVRRQSLAFLAREFPAHPATREALLAARGDPDAEVRLRAGLALGADGRDVLLAVAGERSVDDATAERAVVGLGALLTVEEARGLLRDALLSRRLATARACLGALGRRGGEAVATLAKVLAMEKPELAAVAAEALGETGDAGAEAPLVEALASPHEAVRVAAARGLARVGTPSAVVPLREAEAGEPPLRAAARQAIAQIQSRAKGALPGQLSLAESGAGALSIAEGEPGRVSLAEDEGAGGSKALRGPARARE
jgi:hypothetical protein